MIRYNHIKHEWSCGWSGLTMSVINDHVDVLVWRCQPWIIKWIIRFNHINHEGSSRWNDFTLWVIDNQVDDTVWSCQPCMIIDEVDDTIWPCQSCMTKWVSRFEYFIRGWSLIKCLIRFDHVSHGWSSLTIWMVVMAWLGYSILTMCDDALHSIVPPCGWQVSTVDHRDEKDRGMRFVCRILVRK